MKYSNKSFFLNLYPKWNLIILSRIIYNSIGNNNLEYYYET
jgi:hypothetical protein